MRKLVDIVSTSSGHILARHYMYIRSATGVQRIMYECEFSIVTDGPRFRGKPRSMQADIGASVTLTCDVDGNPPPEIVWIHEDTDRVSHHSK